MSIASFAEEVNNPPRVIFEDEPRDLCDAIYVHRNHFSNGGRRWAPLGKRPLRLEGLPLAAEYLISKSDGTDQRG